MEKTNFGKILTQDELMCLRILRRIRNPTSLQSINLSGEQFTHSFTKAMCLLIQHELVTITTNGQVERTKRGHELLDEIQNLIESQF